jgi:conjugal transfer pilus assembly protein TraE
VPLLIVANIALVVVVLTQDKETVLVPPNITERMSVSKKGADAAYKKSWGLFVASMIGNVTPANADFVNDQMSTLFDGRVYHSMKAEIAAQILEIKSNNLSIEFEPQQIVYEPETDRVFVLGKNQTSGSAGRLSKENRVFEIEIEMSGGRPLVTAMETYSGEARTTVVLEKLERRRIADEERAARIQSKEGR